MRLPNSKNAYIPEEKLLDYLLSEIHPVGRSKAKFFRKLGFNETNIEKLKKALLAIALNNEVESIRETTFGINYVIQGDISTSKRSSVKIKTVWFMESITSKPSFVTAIPGIIQPKRTK